jgi:hypothetical protein
VCVTWLGPVGGIRFNADPIIDREPNALFRSQILFRGLDGDVTQQHLNLFQFAAGRLTESRAGAPEMPHAAFAQLCRMPDYAESPVY